MIARLTGTIIEKTPYGVVVEIGGIGYELLVPARTLHGLAVEEKTSFFVAEHIKEDEYSLFGFANSDERAMYYSLTSVNGVGPKAAMAILSAHEVGDIQRAITQGELSIFSSVSGVGRKTAQRIILELKGKLVTVSDEEVDTEDKAYQALMSLGYNAKDAKVALKDVDASLDTQERIKQALKGADK